MLDVDKQPEWECPHTGVVKTGNQANIACLNGFSTAQLAERLVQHGEEIKAWRAKYLPKPNGVTQ